MATLGTITNLFDDGTYGLTAGAMRDMLARARDDGLVSLAVNVRLADGVVVTRSPTRVRIDHESVEVLGLEVVGVTLDVEAPLDMDPEVRLALGMIGEDEYWDLVSYD